MSQMDAAVAKMDVEAIGDPIRRRLSGFVHTLRENGFTVGLAETRDALSTLASSAGRRRSSLRPALRSLLCATRSDWERFDDIFSAYWSVRSVRSVQKTSGSAPGVSKSQPLKPGEVGAGDKRSTDAPDHVERRSDEAVTTASGEGRREGASPVEHLASMDIRHIADPEEVAKAHALAERLARRMRAKLIRRAEIRRRGRRLDLRRTIHRSISRGGALIDLAWRRRKLKQLRVVTLLDASGSMSLYTAFFVRFLHGLMEKFGETEAFLFHTRLAHVSPSMRDRDAGRAIDRLALMAQGIGGGTKIGESLAAFNRWHAKRVINSRTVVIIISDGYDTGAPELLIDEMRQLRRRCRRIVWLNPLLGWRDYAPEARGMRAALPYVDLFAPAHNLESLAALEPYLARI